MKTRKTRGRTKKMRKVGQMREGNGNEDKENQERGSKINEKVEQIKHAGG